MPTRPHSRPIRRQIGKKTPFLQPGGVKHLAFLSRGLLWFFHKFWMECTYILYIHMYMYILYVYIYIWLYTVMHIYIYIIYNYMFLEFKVRIVLASCVMWGVPEMEMGVIHDLDRGGVPPRVHWKPLGPLCSNSLWEGVEAPKTNPKYSVRGCLEA